MSSGGQHEPCCYIQAASEPDSAGAPAKMRTRLAPTAKDIERRSRNRASAPTSSDILVHLQNIPKMLWSEDILS